MALEHDSLGAALLRAEDPLAVSPRPWLSLRGGARSGGQRLLAKLLVQLLAIAPLPPPIQAAAALYPISLLWPLVLAAEDSPARDGRPADPQRLTKDAFGKTIEYTHSPGTRQEVITDRLGQVRVLNYDERGNVVRETDPAGKVTTRTFDARNNRLTETDANGSITSYTYDASDNLTSVTDALGSKTDYTYNARKQVLTVKDPRGKVTTNVYDAAGNLTSTTDAAGNVTAFTYDARGNVLTQTDALGNVTRNDYDAYGQLTKETNALGHVTTSTYDANGNRLSETRTRTTSSGTETLNTTSTYDKLGRLIETHDPDGTVSKTAYDALGKQVSTTDKLGRTTSHSYDEMARLTKTTYPDGTTEESAYDAEGRRLTSTDRAGRTTRYEYDALGRLTKTIYPDNTFTTNTYDAAGRLVATKDARGNVTTYEYDAAGRRTRAIDALGNVTASTYDAAGNLTSAKDPKGNTTAYEHDDLNRRTRTIYPDGMSATTAYDALGHRTSETDQAGKTTSLAYDALGRLTKVTDPIGQVTSYSYDEAGNRISQTDANNHTTGFEHDKLGRETKRILPGGAFETKAYDLAGNLSMRIDFIGRVTTYGYDATNRLTSRTYSNSAENVGFAYTPTDRLGSYTDARGTASYTYDLRDRLTRITDTTGARIELAWDASGNRVTATAVPLVGSPISASFTYDEASRLDLVTDVLGRSYDLGYDPNGNRTSLAHPNSAVTTYAYDPLNRLSDLTTISGLGTVQAYALTLGPAGNRTRITEQGGKTRDFSYDDLYRLIQEKVTGSAGLVRQEDLTYDAVGNRLTRTLSDASGSATTAYSYDERDRLLTENLTSYTWDANGNLVTKSGEARYFWDTENRLIRVEKADGTVVENAYDPFGNRVQTKTTKPSQATETTNYLVDTSGPLSHVLADLDEAGRIKSYYLRADGELLAILRPDGAGGYTTRHVHSDYIGSVRALTDEAGVVTDTYEYDAWGNLLSHVGSDPQPYAFAGEPYDPNVGWQYHRARWMDPSTGRFTGMDPFGGRTQDPPSLHRYLYAAANPVNVTDPSGRFPFWTAALIGTRVHQEIGKDFIFRTGGFANYTPIFRILDVLPQDCVPFAAVCLARPDLTNPFTFEVYEIKPTHLYTLGILELFGYVGILDINDPQQRPWHFGSTYQPPSYLFIPDLGGWDVVVTPPVNGVITYEAVSRAAVVGTSIASLVLLANRAAATAFASLQAQVGVRTSLAFGF